MPSCADGQNSYRIQAGDSLWAIARRFGTTVEALTMANPGIHAGNLQIGQMICIPRAMAGCISRNEQILSNQMRLLWEQHVYWTRIAISGIVFDLPDADASAARLLQNPGDFQNILRPFYGENIAAAFADLLTSHLTIASELVKAAKAGDTKAAEDARGRWYENADRIAEFLGSINSFWSPVQWQGMLYDHLAMTEAEAAALLGGRYEESISIFDSIEMEALMMADLMTEGIVMQFPQTFS